MPKYINADTFMKKIDRYSLSNGVTLGKHSGVADEIIDMLIAEPAEDVVEVKHGKWINESRMYGTISAQCSVCKLFSGVWLRNAPYKYCPYCGAKMG